MEKVFKENYKTIIIDVLFLIGGGICLLVRNILDKSILKFQLLLPLIIASLLIIIYLFPLGNHEDKKIYENKRAIIPAFIIIAITQIIIYSLNVFCGINSGSNIQNRKLATFIEVCVVLTLFISYFFKIRFKKFNWNISIKSFILILLIYIVYKSLSILFYESNCTMKVINLKFMCDFLKGFFFNSIYPGIYEELLFRGLMVSGLKGFGYSDDKCNVIQAVIFGLFHTGSFGVYSWISLLSTAYQAMMGYVFGKVYFKTKSLTPCILLHGLVDAGARI